jgi:hypothetical protein
MAKLKHREAWHPPQYDPERRKAGLAGSFDKEDIRALQALAQGIASEADQKRSLDWIIRTAAATYDEPFRPGSSDTVNYMLGRRSVGLAIVKLLSLKPEIFKDV